MDPSTSPSCVNECGNRTRLLSTPRQKYILFGLSSNILGAQKPKKMYATQQPRTWYVEGSSVFKTFRILIVTIPSSGTSVFSASFRLFTVHPRTCPPTRSGSTTKRDIKAPNGGTVGGGYIGSEVSEISRSLLYVLVHVQQWLQ